MFVETLVFAYVLVAALVLNLWLRTSWSISFKIGAVVLATGLYAGTWFGMKEIQGWPVREPLPKSFRLHWATIDEPDKVQAGDGWIYLWVQPLDPNGQVTGKPRAHQLPFSPEVAEQVQEALADMEGGQAMEGFMTRGAINPTTDDNQATGEPASAPGDNPEEGLHLEFRKPPRTRLPPKSKPGA